MRLNVSPLESVLPLDLLRFLELIILVQLAHVFIVQHRIPVSVAAGLVYFMVSLTAVSELFGNHDYLRLFPMQNSRAMSGQLIDCDTHLLLKEKPSA